MTANTMRMTVGRDGRWIAFEGDLNYATVDEARATLLAALPPGDETVVLDLRAVDLLASMGVDLLLEARRAAPGRRCVLITNHAIDQVLNITGVARRFTIAHTEEEAGAEFGAAPR